MSAATQPSVVPEPAPFDLLGPLPSGTTVLEASAGTGKTYAIAALVARYLAEGAARLDQMLMVTFSRSATNELRTRIRERLVELDRALGLAVRASSRQPSGPTTAPADELLTFLTTGDPETLAARRERIETALTEFDAATIATTHEFCQRMLAGLGVLGEAEPGATFVEDIADLREEVTADVYLQMFAGEAHPALTFERARELATAVIETPHADLVPAGTQGLAEIRHTFACRVRAEVEHRKQRRRLFTYDDMLTRLRNALRAPGHGEAAARRLSERYTVVLVDEFQDTDPIQWEIVRTAFDRYATVVLIGDPKQAIYAFRGADVFSYLDAVGRAEHVYTLDTNYRSDQALVDALDLLFHQTALGEGIQVRPVRASHQERRLSNADRPHLAAPFRLRYVPDDPERPRSRPVGALRPPLIADLVADITALLSSGTRVQKAHDQEPRPVRPSDIAVLVNRNATGERIRQALADHGVPAVMAGASSVFATEVAQEWMTLLAALESPTLNAARRAALTRFIGWDFPRLAQAGDDELTELGQLVRTWSRVLTRHGVAALVEDITARTDLTTRLLSRSGGERELTDLRHIGQALHAAAVAQRLGLPGLIEWLADRRTEAVGGGDDDRSRRLETDAHAVQLLTVHRSKGLQFPIVYLPEAWDRYVPRDEDDRPADLHRPAEGDQQRLECVLDVGGSAAPGRRERWARHRLENDGESLRLLYVALTRAQCQVVTWWQPSFNTVASPLQRLLFGPRRPGADPDPAYPDTGDPTTLSHLDPGLFSLEQQVRRDPVALASEHVRPDILSIRPFTRVLDLTWRRTSYSSLTAAAHEQAPTPGGPDSAGVTSEAEPARENDEPVPAHDDAAERPGSASPTSGELIGAELDAECPLGALPGGTDFGTLVHAIAEETDPRAADLEAALLSAAAHHMSRLPALPYTAAELVAGLLPAYATALGPLADDRDLAAFGVTDRLAELQFELPLAGGDARLGGAGQAPPPPAAEAAGLGDIAALLRRHLPPGDPLIDYPDALADPLLADQVLRGYLTGSIDAVLRVRSADGSARYLIVDYKTNKLGPLGQTPRLRDYTPPALAAAMQSAHYPLQALLYAVALHRYLRWRQPDYDPDRHLGGVLYLFVRGMAGPATPRLDGVPCGVFSWRPPAALVTDLSDLLDRGRTAMAGPAAMDGRRS